MTYCVRDPFLAVRNEAPGRSAFTTVPEGAIILVRGFPKDSGMVHFQYEGSVLAAFLQDIEERCEIIEQQTH